MSTQPLTAAESRALENEYVAHRPAVLGMLRAEFGGVPDHEELYQEAWTEALEQRARGTVIQNLPGLLRTIAWRRARDRLRNRRADAVDPSSTVLSGLADPAADLDDQAVSRLDSALLRQIIDDLEPDQAAVLKLRFDWHLEAREIQQRLGITKKRLDKIVAQAYRRVEAHLESTADGTTRWSRRQRSLLVACELGLASEKQRARAQRMLERDPVCRAMLREMRSTLEQ